MGRDTISAFETSICIKEDNTVYVKGLLADISDGNDWTDIVSVAVGGSNVAGIRSDGTVRLINPEWGQDAAADWTDIIDISIGDRHTIGLKSDGSVVSAGYNTEGQCGIDGWINIVNISAGAYHSVGLKNDGTAVAVGANDDGHCNVDDWEGIPAVHTRLR